MGPASSTVRPRPCASPVPCSSPWSFQRPWPQGYTAATQVADAPFSVFLPGSQTLWEPKNFSGKFHGPTLLATALIHSINVATAPGGA